MICVALVAAPSAQAGFVQYNPWPWHENVPLPDSVQFRDSAVEFNDLVISSDTASGFGFPGGGAFVLVERGLGALGPDPLATEKTLEHCQFGVQRVRCTTALSQRWIEPDLYLGGGDDKATVKAPALPPDGGTTGTDVFGGEGSDHIVGAAGDDEFDGEAGRDVLVGGAGQDSIEAADGERDKVSCGPGRDRVRADSIDAVNADCESVTRL